MFVAVSYTRTTWLSRGGGLRRQEDGVGQCSGMSDSNSSGNSAREEEINFNSHSEIIYDLIFFNGAEGRPESSGQFRRSFGGFLNSIAEKIMTP